MQDLDDEYRHPIDLHRREPLQIVSCFPTFQYGYSIVSFVAMQLLDVTLNKKSVGTVSVARPTAKGSGMPEKSNEQHAEPTPYDIMIHRRGRVIET